MSLYLLHIIYFLKKMRGNGAVSDVIDIESLMTDIKY